QEHWPEMWRRSKGMDWKFRTAMECAVCTAERRRRCCIIDKTSTEAPRYMEEPFANAPFVHPFRHPAYHAKLLKAINFAKAKNRRLLWVTAHDVLKDAGQRKDQEELRKERWLELHDRDTSGIPGLLPLVLDLPVCFTDSPNPAAKAMGVYKNSRGWLRGWELTDEETSRLQELPDPEVVLRQRPLRLHVEVATATKQMPVLDGKAIYSLTVQMRQWNLGKAGNVKILRYGFPIVPDFGGTAHAYCGTTLDACLGDLLPWYHQLRKEDALRAYIIKSRVGDASQILLTEPYHPHLFRQGVLPGPDLLLQVLQGRLPPEDAKKAWKAVEKEPRAYCIMWYYVHTALSIVWFDRTP
ncbi:MAG: hypothetical protein VX837_04025, partial [Candidatus Thermoplasmatota archaeon]|nr:hypothetical protein [Candidatus Thermoplasmatota archaeon]